MKSDKSHIRMVPATPDDEAFIEHPAACGLVRMRRADGSEFWLKVPREHMQRVLDLGAEAFGGKG